MYATLIHTVFSLLLKWDTSFVTGSCVLTPRIKLGACHGHSAVQSPDLGQTLVRLWLDPCRPLQRAGRWRGLLVLVEQPPRLHRVSAIHRSSRQPGRKYDTDWKIGRSVQRASNNCQEKRLVAHCTRRGKLCAFKAIKKTISVTGSSRC